MFKRILRHKLFIGISIPVAFLALVIISITLFMHSALFKNKAADIASEYFFSDDESRLVLGEVSGNPLANLQIKNLAVRYESDTHSYDIIKIDEIRVDYDLISLIRGIFSISNIEIVNPHLWIKADSAAADSTETVDEGIGRIANVRVDRFSISGGQIIYQSAQMAEAIRGIELEGMISGAEGSIEAGITSGSCSFITRDIELRKITGKAAYGSTPEKGKTISLEKFVVGTELSRFSVSGEMGLDSGVFAAEIAASPIDIDEIESALELDGDEEGRLNGNFSLKGSTGDISIEGNFDGNYRNYSFRDFEAGISIACSDISIDYFRGWLNGAEIDGNGLYRAEGEVLDLSFRGRSLDLSREFYPGAELPETDFNGRMDVSYLFDSSELSLDFYLGRGHFRRIPFNNSVISASYRNDSLLINEMIARSNTHELRINGSIVGTDTIHLLLDLSSDASDTLFSYFNIDGYRADVDLSGLWKGTFDKWDLRLSGECRNFDYRWFLIPGGSIQFAIEKNDDYGVFFDILADTCFIGSYRFNDADLSIEYESGELNVKRLKLAKSDINAEMRGKYILEDEGGNLVIDRAAIRILDEDWVSSGGFNLAIQDSSVFFNDLQLHSRIGALYFDGELERFRNYFDGSLMFDRIDMSVLNRNGLLPIPVEGNARGVIRSSGSLDQPELTVSVSLEEGSIDNIPVDRFDLKALFGKDRCRLDTLSLSSPVGYAFASGDIEGFDLIGTYRQKEKYLENTSSELEIYCGRLSVEPFIEYFPGIPFSDGTFTGKALVTGSLIHPGIRLDGNAGGLVFNHITLERVDMHADLRQDGIGIDGEIYAAENRKLGHFNGNLPLKKESWFYSLDSGRDMSFDLELPEINLEDAADLSDLVARAEGEGSITFTVRGKTGLPELSGELELRGAGFRLAGMEERFRNVNARVSFEDTLINVMYLNGNEGKNGEFSGSGTVSLRGWKPSGYDLTLDLSKVLVTSIRDVAAIVTGRLDIGTETVEGNNIPSLTGDFEVNEAEVYYDPGSMESGAGGGAVASPSWIAKLDLDMKGNTRIRTPDANIEFMGNVTLHHNGMGTYLRGELKLYRGWYNLYNNKFHIQSGSLVFSHAGDKRPLIDIEALTYDQEGKRIYLALVWGENDPQPRLSLRHEESGYSETDIWKMLGGGIVRSPNGSESEWDAMGTAQNLAANYLERVLNSQMEGFTVSLEHGTTRQSGAIGGEKATMLAIGKYLSEGLYVQWKQGLSVATEAEVEVEYRISDLFLIRTEVIKYSKELLPGESMRSGDEINLDVKIRWEF